jgi:hypothetical protein
MPERPLSRAITPGAEVAVMGYPHLTRAVEMRAEWVRVTGQVTPLR